VHEASEYEPNDEEDEIDGADIPHAEASERRGEHRLYRYAGHADGDECRRDKAFALRLENARSQYPRHITAEAEQSGDDCVSVDAEAVEQRVEYDGEARQIAEVLQEGEHRVKGDDVGQYHPELDVEAGRQHPHALFEVDGAVEEFSYQQRAQVPVAEYAAEFFKQRQPDVFKDRVKDVVYKPLSDEADKSEAQREHKKTKQYADHGVGRNVLDTVKQGVVAVGHRLYAGDDLADFLPAFFLRHRFYRADPRPFKVVNEVADSSSRRRYRLVDGNSELFLKFLHVEQYSLVSGLVCHVERDDHRYVIGKHLQ